MKTLLRTFIIAFFAFQLLSTAVASAFTVDLTSPNEAGMPVMTYATVIGTIDSSYNRENYPYFDIISLTGQTLTEDNFFPLSDDPAGNGHGHFAAHIAGFDYNVSRSIFVRDAATAVPEPATILLLGAGLVGIGLFRKRFKK